jgi:hypothetical protein
LLDAGQGFLELFSCLFVSDGFQGSGIGFCQEDAFDGLAIKGLVTKGVLKGHVDVVSVVGLLQPKDKSGVEAAVSGEGFFEPVEKGLCCLSQGEESVSDRFETVADLFGTPVLGFFRGFPCPRRQSFMVCHQLDFRAVDEHFLLGGFQGEDIGHTFVGNGVAVGFKVQEPVDAANPQGDL